MAEPVLVTGADGFIGAPLMRRLAATGIDAISTAMELAEPATVVAAVRAIRPGTIVHLAGLSHVPTCMADPERTMRINRDGTAHLAEALARHGAAGAKRFVFASTAQVYRGAGAAETSLCIDEQREIAPQNVYAESKWEAEKRLRALAAGEGIELTVLRLFTHTHKSQRPDFLLPHIHASLLAGKHEIAVGNLDLYRDIGALGDLLAAFERVLHEDFPGGVFNVCSGEAKLLRDLVEGLAARLGVPAKFVTDPARLRPGEPQRLLGSHARLAAASGWQPRYRTAAQLLDSFLADLP